MATDAKEAAGKGDLNKLYQTTRIVRGRKSGFATRKVISLLKLIHNSYPGKEHFEEVLNRPPPIHQPVLKPEEELMIKTDNISGAEFRSEAIRAGGEVSVEAPYKTPQ